MGIIKEFQEEYAALPLQQKYSFIGKMCFWFVTCIIDSLYFYGFTRLYYFMIFFSFFTIIDIIQTIYLMIHHAREEPEEEIKLEIP